MTERTLYFIFGLSGRYDQGLGIKYYSVKNGIITFVIEMNWLYFYSCFGVVAYLCWRDSELELEINRVGAKK